MLRYFTSGAIFSWFILCWMIELDLLQFSIDWISLASSRNLSQNWFKYAAMVHLLLGIVMVMLVCGMETTKKGCIRYFSTLNLKCLQLHADNAHFSTNIYVFLSFLQSHSTYSTQNTQQAVLKMLRENKDRFDLVIN